MYFVINSFKMRARERKSECVSLGVYELKTKHNFKQNYIQTQPLFSQTKCERLLMRKQNSGKLFIHLIYSIKLNMACDAMRCYFSLLTILCWRQKPIECTYDAANDLSEKSFRLTKQREKRFSKFGTKNQINNKSSMSIRMCTWMRIKVSSFEITRSKFN